MSAVKLFGKTIMLPPETLPASAAAEEIFDPPKQITSDPNPNRSSSLEDGESRSGPEQDESKEPENSKEDRSGLDKTILKKPDTIVPCPRCNSAETKFCYFNNYNVNQPRHFCRNCQRYWTAGGNMRNVPVGAGRRKNKNMLAAAAQFCPMTVPANHPNGAILVFNSDTGAPLCESMVSVLGIVDKRIRSGEMDGDDRSSESSESSSKDEASGNVSVFHGGSWPYPCRNPTIQWTSPTSPPTFDPAIITFPFYSKTPPLYWAGPTICNAPFVITPPAPSFQTLGKHSRDENIPKTQESSYNNDNLEKSLWVPKTLRIDDSTETAKTKSSSIWEALGMKNDIRISDDCVGVCVGAGGLFKAFQSQTKGEQKTKIQETPTALQANPAALSRSVSFRESS